VQLAGAGHPPPLLLSGSGSTTAIETNGGLLGVFAEEQYDQVEIELECDDRLLFYTDGFEQAFPASTNDSLRRHTPTVQYRLEFDLLRSCESAAMMVQEMTRRIDDHAGSLHQVDDLTMICMRAGTMNDLQPIPTVRSGLRLVS
jgi:phosphoserine phosphatase RsbU/P